MEKKNSISSNGNYGNSCLNKNCLKNNIDCHAPKKNESSLDHFVTINGVRFAGYHLIVDFWDAKNLNNLEYIKESLISAVEGSNATLLHIHLHPFEINGGISGVAVLAESHISVHTWPEFGFAAFDIFMCGDSEPNKALEILKTKFLPKKIMVNELKRGAIE